MAITKQKKPPEGCPAWLATYGDLVTNLLVFFVLLFSMSEIAQERKMQEYLSAIREAFGYVEGAQRVALDAIDIPSNIPQLLSLVVPTNPRELNQAEDDAIKGKRQRVTDIRPGEYFQPGGKVLFDELSDELSPDALATVASFAERLRGHGSQIEVRGHCGKRPVAGTRFTSHFDLAWRRATAVANVLISHGIDPDRILVSSVGTARPLTTNPDERHINEFVEILQVDHTTDEFRQE